MFGLTMKKQSDYHQKNKIHILSLDRLKYKYRN
jgi:hypothetical protein